MVNFMNLEIDSLQAVTYGFDREAGPMFDALKALFFDRCDKLAVDHQARCGVSVKSVKTEDIHLMKVASKLCLILEVPNVLLCRDQLDELSPSSASYSS